MSHEITERELHIIKLLKENQLIDKDNIRSASGELLGDWDRSEVMREFEKQAVSNLMWLSGHFNAMEKEGKISDVVKGLNDLGPAAQKAVVPVQQLGKTIKETFTADDSLLPESDEYVDQLPGGLADGKSPEQFNMESLQKGILVEMEHTDDEAIATEIAMDHLTEDPDYYQKLELMEAEVSDSAEDAKLESEAKDSLINELKAMAQQAIDEGDTSKAYQIERTLDVVREES